MTTTEQARAFALGLPEAEEREHMRHPDFRVRGRIFAGFPRPGVMSLRLDPLDQAAAQQRHPDAIAPAAGAWGRQGWTLVTLERIDAEPLRELIEEAWCLRAPARLADAFAAQRRAADGA